MTVDWAANRRPFGRPFVWGKMQKSEKSYARLKLRVKCSFAALGPGKADLLEAVARCGSITAAAKDRNMSYRRAWNLIDQMNHTFRGLVVDTASGGARGGGAQVTDLGREVLGIYREVERLAEEAVAEQLQHLGGLVADAVTAAPGESPCPLRERD